MSSDEIRVTMADVRASGMCSRGARAWAADHGLDWETFLHSGLPVEQLEATGDAMATRVARHARARAQGSD